MWCMCRGIGHFVEAGPLLLPYGSWDGIQVIRLGGKPLCPPNVSLAHPCLFSKLALASLSSQDVVTGSDV